MSFEYIAYVDEAGDEGFGKLQDESNTAQSQWLSLGAILVSRKNDRLLPAWRDEIMALFPNKRTRDLHFRKLNHDQKVATCQFLAEKRMGISVVASNKVTILDSGKKDIFKRKGHLYNYLVRFLLERLTASCKSASKIREETSPQLRVVFSRRAGTDYDVMKEYLVLMRDGREAFEPVRSIDWSVLDPENIGVVNHSNAAGLQLADIVTSATSAALEPNIFGNSEPRYALCLQPRFLHRNRRIANTGLTILPAPSRNPLTPDQRKFLSDIEKVRALGS